jgi:APA family basic amino acid/polyamine antiporter
MLRRHERFDWHWPAPFRVPFDGIRIGGAWIGVVPVLAIVFCIPAFLLGGYCALGALVYFGYGRRHSKLRGART